MILLVAVAALLVNGTSAYAATADVAHRSPAYAASAPTRAGVTADAPPPGSTIVIGTGGLTWSDVSEQVTPSLWAILARGSTAAMTIRSVWTNTCPVDGWLGLGSGARAAAPLPDGTVKRTTNDPCPPISGVTDGTITAWSSYQDAADANRFEAHLGLIGDQAAKAGVCVQGIGPGGALASARSDGTVPKAYDVPGGSGAGLDPSEGARLETLIRECPLTVIDVGSLRDPADVAPGEPTQGTREEQLRDIDARIGRIVSAAPAGSTLLLGSLSDAGRTERLRLAAALGPEFSAGSLVSPSTRQPGLVQAQDLTVTALSLAGIPAPIGLGGAVLGSEPAGAEAATRWQALVDYDQASHEVHSLVPPFFNGLVYAQLVIYLIVALFWKGRIGREETRLRSLGLVRDVAVLAASVPVSTFLANLLPWWRTAAPMLAIVGSVTLFAATITIVALGGPWRRTRFGAMLVVGLATMAVLAIDVMTGSRLQLSSLMGLQPVIGGRYYGMGNVTFALFATSALIVATIVANRLVVQGRRRDAALAAAVIGGLAVVIDGAPFFGADGGGPPALVPALVYLVLAILGLKLTFTRGLVIALATAALFLLVSFLDWLRPAASRSHLGGFFQAILDGSAWDIVARKGGQNLGILFGNFRLTLLVPIALLFVIYVLARPTSWGAQSLRRSFQAAPVLRPGLIAIVIMLTIGFAVNDSGVAIPAVGATILIPFVIATSVRILQEDVRGQDPAELTAHER